MDGRIRGTLKDCLLLFHKSVKSGKTLKNLAADVFEDDLSLAVSLLEAKSGGIYEHGFFVAKVDTGWHPKTTLSGVNYCSKDKGWYPRYKSR